MSLFSKNLLATCLASTFLALPAAWAAETANGPVIHSAGNGAWSSPKTWEGGQVPASGSSVQIRPGDHVIYDVNSTEPIRSIHVAGILSFAPDRDTQMDVGMLLVRPGTDEVTSTDAVGLPAHVHDPDVPQPVLEIGTPDHPIDAAHHALIRLTYIEGMDKDTAPVLIDCGGRMEIHGAPMSRTWVKLRNAAKAGDTTVTLNEPVDGWRAGDRIIIPTTLKLSLFSKGQVIPSVRDNTQTEERIVQAIDGQVLTLDKPLGYDHTAEGDFRGEVADLSRNVVIESADPNGVRGHTMYHHGSSGSISYAEFRHLGKAGVLGRYSLHFHLGGDGMRGMSVVGASIWDSANRFITVHGTNFLVIRDCVGYRSLGHGFFLEDGTEEYNLFDRNLAVQALKTDPLPQQILPFDKNDGAGFWWANSLNAFTRNDAVECDQYGYRFEAGKAPEFNSVMKVRQPDGSRANVDIRTLPFIRFEGNEAHSQRRYGLNLGGFRMVAGNDAYDTDAQGHRAGLNRANTNIGDVDGVGPDLNHPFVIRDFRCWTSQWAFHSAAPNVDVDGFAVYDSNYGIWRSRVDGMEFHNISMSKIAEHDIFVPWGGGKGYDQEYNKSLKPVDDLPPSTVITGIERNSLGDLVVRGVACDNGTIARVLVNNEPARAIEPNFSQWEVVLTGPDAHPAKVWSSAADAAGNVERTPHVIEIEEKGVTQASAN